VSILASNRMIVKSFIVWPIALVGNKRSLSGLVLRPFY
jgi:hypothetical protein